MARSLFISAVIHSLVALAIVMLRAQVPTLSLRPLGNVVWVEAMPRSAPRMRVASDPHGERSVRTSQKNAVPVETRAQVVTLADLVAQGNVPPDYPAEALRRRYQGTTEIRIRVLEAHNEVEMAESSGFPLLDEAALTAARQWKIEQADVGQSVLIPVEFKIVD